MSQLIKWIRAVAPKRAEGRSNGFAFNLDRISLQELNAKINEAVDLLEQACGALELAVPILQDDRDSLVECCTIGPDHDLATLDDGAKDCVARMDLALAAMSAVLANVRGEQ